MKTILINFLLYLICANVLSQEPAVKDLTCEHLKNPLGTDIIQPRFSWKIESSERNVMQTAYLIQVASEINFSSAKIIWQTGKVQSDQSVFVVYDGPELRSENRYYWRVKVWDNKGRDSKWSETGFFEMGLLLKDDWKAKWIGMVNDTNRFAPSPYFRKELNISKDVLKARVYVTSYGYYELHLNGKKVGDQVLTPGWTSYSKRLQYQVYDVTSQLVKGNNAIGAILGDGWYRGWGNFWTKNGKRLGLLMQLHITFKDGTDAFITTDESWKANNDGAIRMADIYNGETYDATKNLTGWDLPGYDDKNWVSVKISEYKLDNLIASQGDPVRKIQEIRPVKVFRTPKGNLIVDMGQNIGGWVRLKVTGSKGTVITLRHAEVMDKYGEFYNENLRGAKCQLKYTLAGTGEEIYEPRFTFMGFRYVEVKGFPGELTAENITGIVVHSDMAPTGTYECSNLLVNQLQHNILWGTKGNFIDIPLDDPSRDERWGWTGDAMIFCRTAAFNMDVSSVFIKWLKDVAADQKPGGEVPVVIPDILNRVGSTTAETSAGWGDVAVVTPWTIYTVYGDKRVLETQYTSMKAWVEYIRKKAGERYIWKGGSIYGDWLFYHPPVNSHPEPDGYTEPDFIATAFYAYSAKLLSQTAGLLGKTEDEKLYSDLYNRIKEVFMHEYVTLAGRVGTNSQTSYVLALMFDLLPEEMRQNAAQFLVDDIKSRKNHLSTGFLGTAYLCEVLTRFGFTNVAYDLLLQESYPSWLYPVKMGATTIWERWDGQKTDSTFQDTEMNSFNIKVYGVIGDWMYRVSAGIETIGAGYKHILIQPHPGSKLNYARATFESSFGTISSGWERVGNKNIIRVKIPANTIATIVLPVQSISKVTESGKSLTGSADFANIRTEDKSVKLDAGSGDYVFEIVE